MELTEKLLSLFILFRLSRANDTLIHRGKLQLNYVATKLKNIFLRKKATNARISNMTTIIIVFSS